MIAAYETHLRKVEFMFDERSNFDCLDVDYREALDDPTGRTC